METRLTSAFPANRDSLNTVQLLYKFISFVYALDDVTRIVFVDKKIMKEKDIYYKLRRDVVTGRIPTNRMNTNSKNRFNILAAVTVKGGSVRPVEFVILQKEYTNAHFILLFV